MIVIFHSQILIFFQILKYLHNLALRNRCVPLNIVYFVQLPIFVVCISILFRKKNDTRTISTISTYMTRSFVIVPLPSFPSATFLLPTREDLKILSYIRQNNCLMTGGVSFFFNSDHGVV